MTSLALQRFDNDGLEILINEKTGESFASAKSYSRMSGKDYDTIKKRCQRNGGLVTAEIPTEQGLRWGTLITESLIAEWLPKDNPHLATQLIKLGVRGFLHKLAGYQLITYDPTKLSKLQILEMAIESEKKYLAEQEKNKLLTETINEQAPLVKLAESLTTKNIDIVTIGELGRSYGIGLKNFYRFLRYIRFIQRKPSTMPYQRHIDAGRAEIVRKECVTQPGKYSPCCVITTKGQQYIAGKMVELDNQRKTQPLTRIDAMKRQIV